MIDEAAAEPRKRVVERARKARCSAEGRCSWAGCTDPKDGPRQYCHDHRIYMASVMKSRYATLRAEGRCIDCRGEAGSEARCAACKEKRKAKKP